MVNYYAFCTQFVRYAAVTVPLCIFLKYFFYCLLVRKVLVRLVSL